MVRLGKRRRTIVVSDNEDAGETVPGTSKKIVTPAKSPPSTPSNDAKFWVEIPKSKESTRKPLSSLDHNSTKKVQLSLDNFFHRNSKKAKVPEPAADETAYPTPDTTSPLNPTPDNEDPIDSLEDSEIDNPRPKKKAKVLVVADKKRKPPVQRKVSTTTTSRASRQAADQSDLPPISSIPKMFDDLVSRASHLDRVVDRLNGRKLRVATMCSGTESPLLALRMITRSLFKETGKQLEIEHIFSCEIEPFKQAYIERNFSPPILFRDVLELANDYAHTAYGAKVRVPGNVDILIAGTSCVDYSQLNRNKKTIEAKGESGRTFQGMLKWVDKHRPPLVVLENICTCPWDKVCNYFKEKGYSAAWCRFDTKNYYIPHTRTRGYAFAVDLKNSQIPGEWKAMVQNLSRPSSSPLEAFLLPVDDPRIHQSRQNLARESERRAGRVDWGKCESRHQRVRLEEGLGLKRPFTQWKEDGSCLLPDFAWADWATGQVDRVLDLLDISLLKSAQKGIDQTYKTQVLNVSQNVDRGFASARYAICPCLTPQGLPYVSNRGGPLLGLEALSMQGLPIDELLLTRESEDNLRDLAGNAMSSTVVGACIISALIVGTDQLEPGTETPSEKMDVDEEASIESRIKGEDQLTSSSLDLAKIEHLPIRKLLADASRSVRLCECEGRGGSDLSPDQAHRCVECNFTSCLKCGQKPTHNYNPLTDFERLHPSNFEKVLKLALPMRLAVGGVTDELLDDLRGTKDGSRIAEKSWNMWTGAVRKATVESELKFKLLKRQEMWSAAYESPHARMELLLDPHLPEWRLYGKGNDEEPANAPIRKMLIQPLARMRIGLDATSLLDGKWEFSLPISSTFEIQIEGTGELLPSWEARLGLLGKFQEKKSWSHLKITAPEDVHFDQEITGVYKWLENCGTATGALHKKEGTDGKKPLYFFFDPTRCGEPEEDFFVFSTSTKRYVWGEERPLTATVNPSWRPTDKEGVETVECYTPGEWVTVESIKLISSGEGQSTTVAIPEHIHARVTEDACCSANALLVCQVPVEAREGDIWPTDGLWMEVDKVHERVTYQGLAWLTERVRRIDSLAEWMDVELPTVDLHCERCAPATPSLKWVKKQDKKWHPIEDPTQAGSYEQRMKNRPSPFVTQLRLSDGIGSVRIGLNVASLLHRALSRLPTEGRSLAPRLSWRLTANYDAAAIKFKPNDPAFTLRSNKLDPENAQPPNFKKFPLRPEQLRSLSWMLERERSDDCFFEEEVSEAMLGPLGWRAEGKAVRPVLVRGGVLADEVGYGKTAITLGLIDCSHPAPYPNPTETGVIPSKATLIVVPSHLGNQWPSEIEKFLGKGKYKIVRILNLGQLNGFTISDIADADIVVVSSSLFRSNDYLSNLSTLAATKDLPASDGRYFTACLRSAIDGLHGQVDRLRTEGAAEVIKVVEEGLLQEPDDAIELSKRIVGSKYAAVKEQEDMQVDTDDASEDEKPKKKLWKDSWKLKTPAVRNNWRKMQAPPLEMFHFNRLVVDEYTYLEGKIHAAITSINADHRWVLSGTPPIHDFAAVKTIAVFLGIHLGVDDDAEGNTEFVKKRKREQTSVEKFHSFREVHSPDWHRRRHEVAQQFLDQFMRKNTADIDEIPWEEHKVSVILPAAERAIYLELKHHLDALDMVLKKSKLKSESDRDKRLQESLGQSDSAEEALLKRCSHFDLDFSAHKNSENAPKQCDVIVAERTKQLKECKEELKVVLQEAQLLHRRIEKSDEENHYERWLKVTHSTGAGDADATKQVRALIEEAAKVKPPPTKSVTPKKAKPAKKPKKVEDDEDDEVEEADDPDKPKSNADLIWDLREKTHRLRRLEKELVGRVRSLRYFEGVRDLQKSKGVLPFTACPICSRHIKSLADISILSSCGHMGCHSCLSEAAGDESCPTEGCRVAAVVSSVIRATTLGEEDTDRAVGRHFGIKLEEVMKLIETKIPSEERVLLFVQFDDLMKKVSEALDFRGIAHLQIAGSASKKSNTLEQFQNNQKARVLLLNVIDESASGANLTNANHAIFLSPLLAVSKQAYDARETQAIGRVRRYGQVKHVHIYRFLTMDSVDETIYKERTGLGRDEAIEGCIKVANLDL